MASTGPVLMSANNPDGWKLEELLAQLRKEIDAKTKIIQDKVDNGTYEPASDQMLAAKKVISYNNAISGLFHNCETLQRQNLATLLQLGADPGPTGTPRI